MFAAICFCLHGCGAENEKTAPAYPEGTTFTLELRLPSSSTEKADGDAFAHSTTDGELICSWEVDYFGETVYDAVTAFYSDGEEKITFYRFQHRYYMFESCRLKDATYDLKTAYIAANGKYSNVADRQYLVGKDGVYGTNDDLKILTIVYRGWLY